MKQGAPDEGGEAGRRGLARYLTGFTLAVALTVIPFALVIDRMLAPAATLAAILAAALAQILVHLRYFLHLDRSAAERWNLAAVLFTAAIVTVLTSGAIWIMFNLHARTMERPATAMMAGSPKG
jgi:cytochrome o ubiquinol oxidase operon protein cyoD